MGMFSEEAVTEIEGDFQKQLTTILQKCSSHKIKRKKKRSEGVVLDFKRELIIMYDLKPEEINC